MIFNNESAKKVAQSLLQIKAIKLQPNQPFSWASGWNSPIYCDNRKILSYPKIRTFIRHQFVLAIEEFFPKAEVIAGVATGGIAIGALVAEEMGLPFIYVRASAKGHGLQNMIEGEIPTDKNVVIIEDLISTGGSSLTALAALRDAKCNVLGMVAIFTYGFETAEQNFKENKCKLITLSDYDTLITTAEADNYIAESDIKSLAEWRKNPSEWKK
ncbi:MAG: Orotate phosphoribosyltransferase [Flavobacteriales bacterium]|nr:Orotate phosphoribosyltransferase [Flavobacteriales bacterium]